MRDNEFYFSDNMIEAIVFGRALGYDLAIITKSLGKTLPSVTRVYKTAISSTKWQNYRKEIKLKYNVEY